MAEKVEEAKQEAIAAATMPAPPEDGVPAKAGDIWAPPTAQMQGTSFILKMLIYGQSGVGKTRLAASAADVKDLSPVLFVDAEAGTMSIRERKDLEVFRMSDYAALQKFVAYMRGDVGSKYKTVVIDSLTDVGRVVIRQCVVDARQMNSNHDREIPEMRDWGRYTERMKIIIRALRDAPVNVILTALIRDQKDELSGKISYSPALQGAAASTDAMAYVDLVGYFAPIGGGANKPIPTLHFASNPQYVAKDRSGFLPEKMEDPTFAEIYKYITGGKK